MTLREAAQQALEAIERALPHAPHCGEFDALADMADDLRAALAEPVQEPVQEPVGWFESPHGAFRANPLHKIIFPSQLMAWQIPVYTAPPQRNPLTEGKPWVCACGVNLYIDADGKPRSKA